MKIKSVLNMFLVGAVAFSLTSNALAIVDIKGSQITDFVGDRELVILEAKKVGCPFCVKMSTVVARFEQANPSVPIFRIDYKDPEFQKRFKLNQVPAFIVFRRGKFSHAFFGLMENKEFFEAVFFQSISSSDPSIVGGVRELLRGVVGESDQLSFVSSNDGYYSLVVNDQKSVGRMLVDGTVSDVNGAVIGRVNYPILHGECCARAKNV